MSLNALDMPDASSGKAGNAARMWLRQMPKTAHRNPDSDVALLAVLHILPQTHCIPYTAPAGCSVS